MQIQKENCLIFYGLILKNRKERLLFFYFRDFLKKFLKKLDIPIRIFNSIKYLYKNTFILIMKIPNSFKTALDKQDKQEEKERLREIKEEQDAKKQRKLFRQKENSKMKEKIKICKKIFIWKDEFLKSKDGIKIFNKSNKNLFVFNGLWAHEPQEHGRGCWARIYFNSKDIEYCAGYKWMGGGPTYLFAKPKDMAKLNYKFLKKFLTEIENGKIFDNILKLNSY